jgi:hypothetical protein
MLFLSAFTSDPCYVRMQAGILQCARRPLGRLGAEVFASLLAAAAVPECATAFCAAVAHACEQHDDNRVTAGPAATAAVLATLPASSPETATQAFLALRWLLGGATYAALQPAHTAACVQALPSVVATMRRHAAHEPAATRACAMLGKLAHEDAASSAIVAADGVGAILAVMDVHPAEPILQEIACVALGNLAAIANDAAALVAAGGLTRIVRALTALPDARALQVAGLTALYAAANTAATRAALVTSGGLARVCAAMTAFRDSCRIQRIGSLALYVAALVPEGKVALLAGGVGTQLLQRVMSDHSTCADTRRYAEKALGVLNA